MPKVRKRKRDWSYPNLERGAAQDWPTQTFEKVHSLTGMVFLRPVELDLHSSRMCNFYCGGKTLNWIQPLPLEPTTMTKICDGEIPHNNKKQTESPEVTGRSKLLSFYLVYLIYCCILIESQLAKPNGLQLYPSTLWDDNR